MTDDEQWEGHTAAEFRTELASISATGRQLYYGLWVAAAVTMIFSMITVTGYLASYGVPLWAAWMVPFGVDVTLWLVLRGDRVLQRHEPADADSAGWRYTLIALTWGLNVGGSLMPVHGGADIRLAILHSVTPLMLVIAVGLSERFQRRFARLTARLEEQGKAARVRRPHIEPKPAAPVKPQPAAPRRTPRDEVVTRIAAQMREPGWTPDYPALMAETGFGRSWCEKVIRDARAQAPARLEAVR